MKHFPSVVIISLQLTEHDNTSLRYNMLRQLPPSHDSGQKMEMYLMHETGSLSCHRLMTTVRAWLFIPEVWIMLCQLPSSHDNGQNMVIYP